MKNEQNIIQTYEFAIDHLLDQFHCSVEKVSQDPEHYQEMIEHLQSWNPRYQEITGDFPNPESRVLAQVVSGIYVPLIHGFAKTTVENIAVGNLPPVVFAPPRDAIPLGKSIQAFADMNQVTVQVIEPLVNRNTAGIANNQIDGTASRDPLLNLHLEQVKASMNGIAGIVEVETGIYGTTSLVMAEAMKALGVPEYSAFKFYGLGPNLSYVHGVLSGGESWVADEAEAKGLVDPALIKLLMIVVDSMEELGMQNWYQSVETLTQDKSGDVVPVIEPVSLKALEIAQVTNQVIEKTAEQYVDISPDEVQAMLERVDELVTLSREGMPFTLKEAIPSMDSKQAHFDHIISSGVFDYPQLVLEVK